MARALKSGRALLSWAIPGVLAACAAPESLPAAPPDAPPPLSDSGASGAAGAWPPGCAGHAEALALLEARYGEVPVALGVASSGALLEITAAPSGSWTLILTLPDSGAACPVAAGEGWRMLAPLPGGPEA